MIAFETFTILSRQMVGQDPDNNDIYGDVEIETRGAFSPKGSVVSRQGQFQVIDQDTAYLAPGEPVPDINDRIRVRGKVYDIDSEPAVWRNPYTGSEPGASLQLRAVTG